MATADTVKNQLQALIGSANAKTGKADADLTAAVGSLMEGYGIGSDPVLTELTITENGEYTPSEGVDGFSKVVANVAASGDGAGSKVLFQTMDITVDNTSVYEIALPVDDNTLDNYVVDYTCIETGVYTDGVLTIDDVPTFPISMNLPVFGMGIRLKEQLKFNGNFGAIEQTNKYYNCTAGVVRASLSTYAQIDRLQIGNNGLGISSQYNFGKSGYYFKFRFMVYGWNNPEVA